MNSLEIIKQELSNQKFELEQKGFSVPITNKNPSPAEITSAIKNIPINFTITTATASDVRKGKTFYSQDSELKTGTLDNEALDRLEEMKRAFVSGTGLSMEIEIPDGITEIRDYCFYNSKSSYQNLFYATNLDIPERITYIGSQAFSRAQIHGHISIPSTCTALGSAAFAYCPITEAFLYGGLYGSSSYLFENCSNLAKVFVGPAVTAVSAYVFQKCSSLREIIIDNSKISITNTFFYSCDNNKTEVIKFIADTPCIFQTNAFTQAKTVTLLVPYLSYDTYYNATNIRNFNNLICGFGQFKSGDIMPSSIDGYTIIWYSSISDLKAQTNPLTIAPSPAEYYGAFTPPTETE